MKPQTRLVLALLRAHPEGLTPLMALHAGAGFRLGARVWELRDAGYDVRSERVPGESYVRYVLHEAPVQTTAALA